MTLFHELHYKCTVNWTVKDFRNIDKVIDTFQLKKYGWEVFECGTATKPGFSFSNRGILTIEAEDVFEKEFEEWQQDDEIVDKYTDIFNELTEALNL